MTSKNKTNTKSSDNFTINDFANAAGLHGRKKPSAKNVSKKDTLLEKTQQIDAKSKGRKSKQKSKAEEESDPNTAMEYPLDLWFLISEYIEPEAIGKFALICRSSYQVTKSAKFWFHLYKRYYVNSSNPMPLRLSPQRMVQVEGLRASVIRVLHILYFGPKQMSVPKRFTRQDPDCLLGRRCVSMWNKKTKTRWYCFFKMKEVRKRSIYREEMDFDEDKKSGNVMANSEEGCKILLVSSIDYGKLPLVTGLILQRVKMNVTPPFTCTVMQLYFGTGSIASDTTQVVHLNSSDYVIMDWWNPDYPHEDPQSSTIFLGETMETWDSEFSDYLAV